MRKIKRSYIFQYMLFFGIIIISGLYSESIPKKYYEGDITENDFRVEDLRRALQKGESAPDAIRVRYSGQKGDFLDFYDYSGRSVYFRFREDRFDSSGDKKVESLQPGEAYLVEGVFQSIILKGEQISAGDRRFQESLSNKDSIPGYLFKQARSLRMDSVIFR